MVRQPPMKAHGMSDSARKAELLFETSSVAEIREASLQQTLPLRPVLGSKMVGQSLSSCCA